MNEKIKIHNRCYEKSRESITKWDIPKIEKSKFIDFLGELSLGRVNKGKRIGEDRLTKYISTMKVPLEYWGNSLDKINMKDIESFEKDLSSDKIKKLNGEPYSNNSKSDMRKVIKIYFKWRLGEAKGIELTGWLDVRVPNTTPDYLKEEEIEILYRSCRNAKERFMIAVLFDTGARAEEFYNIRVEDVTLPNGSSDFPRITLKEEYSKTKGRVISLYWKYSLEAVRDYLREMKEKGITSKEPIMEGNYDMARAFIRRLGESKLKKRVHFHLFRHSSATYYADKMNRQQLCIRYGWAFSSDMPDKYIARAGVNNKELDEKMSGTQIEKVKDDFFRKEQEWKMKHEDMERKLKEMNKNMEYIMSSKLVKEAIRLNGKIRRREV